MSREVAATLSSVVKVFGLTLKNELIHRHQFQTRDEAQRAIFGYIEVFYNRTRRHTSIGNISPMDLELQPAKAAYPPVRRIGGGSDATATRLAQSQDNRLLWVVRSLRIRKHLRMLQYVRFREREETTCAMPYEPVPW